MPYGFNSRVMSRPLVGFKVVKRDGQTEYGVFVGEQVDKVVDCELKIHEKFPECTVKIMEPAQLLNMQYGGMAFLTTASF